MSTCKGTNLERYSRASIVWMKVLHRAFIRLLEVVRGDVVRNLKQVGVVLEFRANRGHVSKYENKH